MICLKHLNGRNYLRKKFLRFRTSKLTKFAEFIFAIRSFPEKLRGIYFCVSFVLEIFCEIRFCDFLKNCTRFFQLMYSSVFSQSDKKEFFRNFFLQLVHIRQNSWDLIFRLWGKIAKINAAKISSAKNFSLKVSFFFPLNVHSI